MRGVAAARMSDHAVNRLTDAGVWQAALPICHAEGSMTNDAAQAGQSKDGLILGIDTCGPSGSVALAKLSADTLPDGQNHSLEIVRQIELAGKTYSATLV